MIHNISIRLAKCSRKNNIIGEDDYESLAYGFEIIISAVTGILLVVILGMIYGSLAGSLLFLLSYCSVRAQAGDTMPVHMQGV